ncbi:Serine-aspartate repeat-containing protein D precursor [Arcanobacterium haemolyticum]|uniref:SdrD B-like domain-containing protein n=1 Tax=Arcanobacterium haemolyticum TaxID=28264 RepID=UPI000D89334C|nr:Serine-aspartate repeat-containing protein D precursor [Arcanobacterium haemolyticum]
MTDSESGWQVIQDLVGLYNGKTRYYYVEKDPKFPTSVPEGKPPYKQIKPSLEEVWNEKNGDKSYGWVDTELIESPDKWLSIPQAQPLMVSRNAKEVSVELNNFGQGKTGSRQGIVAGIFLPTDQGDAPESYGEASHILSDWRVTGQPKGQGPEAPDVKFEPKNYVGEKPSERDGGKNWTKEGHEASAKGDIEEDVAPKNFTEGFTEKGGKVTILATLTNAKVYAWVDIDANGKFDLSERREGIYADGNVTFDWSDVSRQLKTNKDYYARIRVLDNGQEAPEAIGAVLGGEVEDLKFMVPSVSVGDFVWYDKNGNGIQETGEEGLADVELKLVDEQDNEVKDVFGKKVENVKTNEQGKYSFNNLPVLADGKKYKVVVVKDPEGMIPTKINIGSNEKILLRDLQQQLSVSRSMAIKMTP